MSAPTPPAANAPTGVKQILLLDDEPSVLFALKLLLQAFGFTVKDFSAPDQALEFLSSGGTADVFLCDLRMPKTNGLDVLRRTKTIRPGLQFILMSAHASEEEIAKARELGAFDFLPKPFEPQAAVELLKRVPVGKA
jgi:DNA-binding NtrC family response regulator